MRYEGAVVRIGSAVIALAAIMLATWVTIKELPRIQSTSRLEPIINVVGQRVQPAQMLNRLGLAPIAIVEFTDYQCPFCGRFNRETFVRIRRELVETGHVSYVSVHFPLENIHSWAFKASEAVECAGAQDHFWEMHDRLFQNQRTLGETDLVRAASEVGIDTKRFRECLAGEMIAKVRADRAEGLRLRIIGTPTFLIGRVSPEGALVASKRVRGAVSFEMFEAAIEEIANRRPPWLQWLSKWRLRPQRLS